MANRDDLDRTIGEGHPPGRTLAFGPDGPKLDGVPLTRRVRKGWVPAEQEMLERELLGVASLAAGDFVRRLDVVCKAMNMGDFATAAIAAEHATRDLARRSKRAVRKASPDDPVRPGWPAKTPDGKGGKFRPKDDGTSGDQEARLRRLLARRGLRSTLRRIMTFRRAARLASEIMGDAVPGLDILSGAASLADAIKLGADAAADAADTEAGIAFAEKGPQALEDLQMSGQTETFPSYSSFQKSDLEKRFGAAGKGYEYHHIVEQGALGPDGVPFSAEELNSTENVIRIPRLFHEEVTSFFARRGIVEGETASSRELMRGKSFADQYRFGQDVLRRVGVLR